MNDNYRILSFMVGLNSSVLCLTVLLRSLIRKQRGGSQTALPFDGRHLNTSPPPTDRHLRSQPVVRHLVPPRDDRHVVPRQNDDRRHLVESRHRVTPPTERRHFASSSSNTSTTVDIIRRDLRSTGPLRRKGPVGHRKLSKANVRSLTANGTTPTSRSNLKSGKSLKEDY